MPSWACHTDLNAVPKLYSPGPKVNPLWNAITGGTTSEAEDQGKGVFRANVQDRLKGARQREGLGDDSRMELKAQQEVRSPCTAHGIRACAQCMEP